MKRTQIQAFILLFSLLGLVSIANARGPKEQKSGTAKPTVTTSKKSKKGKVTKKGKATKKSKAGHKKSAAIKKGPTKRKLSNKDRTVKRGQLASKKGGSDPADCNIKGGNFTLCGAVNCCDLSTECCGGGVCRPKLENGKCWETSDDDDSDDGGKKKKKKNKKTETE